VNRSPELRFADATKAHQELARLNPSTMLARPETPVTAIETPKPPRPWEGQPPLGTRPPTTMSPVSRSLEPGWRRPAILVGLLVLAFAVSLVWRGRMNVPIPAATVPPPPPPAASALIRLHGSNTIGGDLGPALAEAFLSRRTASKSVVRKRTAPDETRVEAIDGSKAVEAIEIFAHGTATAFQDLATAACDVGMASRRIHPDEAEKLASLGDLASAASEHVIALDGIVVIVNPANPVTSLTTGQIGDVFSGKVVSWKAVGGADRPIAVHARDDRSGTYDTFRQLVLAGRSLVADARRHESSDELSDAVAADANAIGFIGLPYVRSAKAVMVQEAGSAPLLPSPLSVSTEDYPLARRLYLYLPPGSPIAAHDFVDFALSEEGQRVVQAAGFVDLRPTCDPNAARCASCDRDYQDAVRGACRLSMDFRFDRGNSQLDTRALRDLQRVVTFMQRPELAGRSLVLLGFSDGAGARAETVTLSQQRASMVATQLRARGLRVDVERGLGPQMPVADDATEEGRLRNRRVEVWLR
jgi:phosphate transport system substrate-binding protein